MTESLDVGNLRSESVAFRLEISDFGAFYERTYDTAYRTALGIVRDPALAADVTQEPTSPPIGTGIATEETRHRRRGCTASSSTRRCRRCAGVEQLGR